MIISHKFRFIFIKTWKTAGTSIEVFLSRACGETDVVTPIHPVEAEHRSRNYQGYFNPLPEILFRETSSTKRTLRDLFHRNRFYNHVPARIVRTRVRRTLWDSYFKFCVERNPWDKTLSHYYMLNDRRGGNLSFDQYIQMGRYCINYPQYMDKSGKRVLVDRVLRYESLDQDLSNVFNALGVPFNGTLGVRAKGGHRRDRRSYREAFPARYRDTVEQIFRKELDLHGYSF